MTIRAAACRLSRRGLAAAAAGPVAALVLAGCGLLPGSHAQAVTATTRPPAAAPPAPVTTTGPPAAASPAPVRTTTPAQPACPPSPSGFSCAMRARIAAVEHYLRHRPGLTGVVLRDRSTGAVWQSDHADTPVYMASTSKLAMALTLLLQNRAGVIHLSSTDMTVMHRMLHVSSDSAADDLWFKYGGSFYTSFFPRIGLTSVQYFSVPQDQIVAPYWGEMACPPVDLSRLINYVLTDAPAPVRTYLVTTLRGVAPDQHFGVWGAGPANQPGNKDGWSLERPGWIIDSVGFAGPGARYTLAMMNSLEGYGGYRDGTNTLTQVAAILFQGHQIPAPDVQATP